MSEVRMDPAAVAPVRNVPSWVGLLFAGLFVLHAANYLYFFVDDEAIPYVFAQNLLDGKGLRYNSFEGPVEGYSDFLHVLDASIILGAVRLLHLPKETVFEINTALSLACGAGITWLTFGMLRRLTDTRGPALIAAMAFLVLAGPLAVWSCSSLEMATFAFLVTLLAALTLEVPADVPVRWPATACAVAGLLARIDGFVYIGAVMAGAMLIAQPRRRRDLWMRVVLPSVAVFAAYQAWRIWYFHALLPPPVASKVLYKLHLHEGALVKAPPHNYVRAFLASYGTVPFLLLCLGGLVWRRDRVVVACGIAAALITAYLAVVGDWMFGFRFFVPVIPLLAVLCGHTLSATGARWRFARIGFAALCIVWFAASARTFFGRYEAIERHESWLAHPTFDPHRHFARYYSLMEQAGTLLHRGTRTAFNQAGFVPFMLELDNIDNLGLCSRFFAELPTTDLFMTEVGRYEPPTNKPVHKAGEAYLLYREPSVVIYPADLVRDANGTTREMLFGGYYRFAFIDDAQRNAVYTRTDRSVAPFQTEPRHFLENLAHVSHVRRVTVNGATVPSRTVASALPWLREKEGRVSVAPRYSLDITFGDVDEAVYELYVDVLAANAPVTVTVELLDASGATVHRESVHLDPHRVVSLYTVLPDAVRARRVVVEARGPLDRACRMTIGDLRIQGQTPALADYIHRTLRFPAP